MPTHKEKQKVSIELLGQIREREEYRRDRQKRVRRRVKISTVQQKGERAVGMEVPCTVYRSAAANRPWIAGNTLFLGKYSAV